MRMFNQVIILSLLFCFSTITLGATQMEDSEIEFSEEIFNTLNSLLDEEVIHATNHQQQNLLHLAVFTKDLNLIKDVYNRAPSLLKGKDEDGDSPFLYSCIVGSEEISIFFLEEGEADINETNNSLYTCLHYSVGNLNLKHARAMRAKGADPTKQDEDGDTPAHILLQKVAEMELLYDSINQSINLEDINATIKSLNI